MRHAAIFMVLAAIFVAGCTDEITVRTETICPGDAGYAIHGWQLGQHFRAIRRYGDGMLKLYREATIRGSNRPVVAQDTRPPVSTVDDWLQSKRHPWTEPHPGSDPGVKVVGDLRILVHLPADAVTCILAHD